MDMFRTMEEEAEDRVEIPPITRHCKDLLR